MPSSKLRGFEAGKIGPVDNNDYIVQVNNGLYVLNWNVDEIVNITLLENHEITKNIDSAMFVHKIRQKGPK